MDWVEFSLIFRGCGVIFVDLVDLSLLGGIFVDFSWICWICPGFFVDLVEFSWILVEFSWIWSNFRGLGGIFVDFCVDFAWIFAWILCGFLV